MALLRRVLFVLSLLLPGPVLADVGAGYDALDRGDYAVALSIFSELAATGNADALLMLGLMRAGGLGLPKDHAAAAALFAAAAERGQVEAQIALGYAYAYGLGVRRDLALSEAWTAKAAETGDPVAINNLVYGWADAGRNLEDALSLIDPIVRREPDTASYVDTLGWVLYRMGRIEEAVPLLCRAVALEPGHPELRLHLGDALWRLGLPEQARREWRQGLALPTHPEMLSEAAAELLGTEAIRDWITRLQRRLAEGVPGYPPVGSSGIAGGEAAESPVGCMPPLS